MKEIDLSKVKPEEVVSSGDDTQVLSITYVHGVFDHGNYLIVYDGGFLTWYFKDGKCTTASPISSLKFKSKTVTYVKSMVEILKKFPEWTFNSDGNLCDTAEIVVIYRTYFHYLGLPRADHHKAAWRPDFLKQVEV